MGWKRILLFFIQWNALVGAWFFPKKVCYGTLGCFETLSNVKVLPRSPEKIGTKFLLFTNTSTEYQELSINSKQKKCQWRTFCSKREVKIIIHGYWDHVNRPWVKNMVKALLRQGDYNVIVVDWLSGAREVNYYQSAANIRVVGTQVAQLLKILKKVYDVDPGTVHIIGHSLGAHAAGYAGESLPSEEKIGRITGLDPAGPAFRSTAGEVRLDSEDANFVDVIHTDGEHLLTMGFGLMTPIGDVDFYPNGGKDQPGCPATFVAQLGALFTGDFDTEGTVKSLTRGSREDLENCCPRPTAEGNCSQGLPCYRSRDNGLTVPRNVVDNVACNHLRAIDLFTESINAKCTLKAYPCQKITAASKTTCRSCKDGCEIMGYHNNNTIVDKPKGKYYLETTDTAPFCEV